MTPIEIAYRAVNKDASNCDAQKGEPCKWPYPWSALMGFHEERQADAAALTVNPYAPSKPAFDAAVENSGRG